MKWPSRDLFLLFSKINKKGNFLICKYKYICIRFLYKLKPHTLLKTAFFDWYKDLILLIIFVPCLPPLTTLFVHQLIHCRATISYAYISWMECNQVPGSDESSVIYITLPNPPNLPNSKHQNIVCCPLVSIVNPKQVPQQHLIWDCWCVCFGSLMILLYLLIGRRMVHHLANLPFHRRC
jgi:hypothetical protein